jgi:hypothetical protein
MRYLASSLSCVILFFSVAAVASADNQSVNGLSSDITQLVNEDALAWQQHEQPNGLFADPFDGVVSGYGVSMLGEEMASVGITTGDESLVDGGLLAESSVSAFPENGSFELLSVSDNILDGNLVFESDPRWTALEPQLAANLSIRQNPVTGGTASDACFSSNACYDNLKLVQALGELAALDTGVQGQAQVGALLDNREQLRSQAFQLLTQRVPHEATDNAHVLGQSIKEGILSDPTRDPLAYDVLSAFMLGKLEEYTPVMPSADKKVFLEIANGIVDWMSPSGNVSYIGRGQAQIWNTCAAIDVMARAALLSSGAQRARFLEAAAVIDNRLNQLYPLGTWGIPLTPRMTDIIAGVTTSAGIDGYANTVGYNGLGLWALSDAVSALNVLPDQDISARVPHKPKVFIDPSATGFATVRKGDLWLAVHHAATSPDSRYDVGVVAAERKLDGQWVSILPARPLTGSLLSQGPSRVVGAGSVALGGKVTASAKGSIQIKGGWGHDKGLVTYQPQGQKTIGISVRSRQAHAYNWTVWVPAGDSSRVINDEIQIVDSAGNILQSWHWSTHIGVYAGPTTASAYDQSMTSVIARSASAHSVKVSIISNASIY